MQKGNLLLKLAPSTAKAEDQSRQKQKIGRGFPRGKFVWI
jgi:hypothetical protein